MAELEPSSTTNTLVSFNPMAPLALPMTPVTETASIGEKNDDADAAKVSSTSAVTITSSDAEENPPPPATTAGLSSTVSPLPTMPALNSTLSVPGAKSAMVEPAAKVNWPLPAKVSTTPLSKVGKSSQN